MSTQDSTLLLQMNDQFDSLAIDQFDSLAIALWKATIFDFACILLGNKDYDWSCGIQENRSVDHHYSQIWYTDTFMAYDWMRHNYPSTSISIQMYNLIVF